MRGASLRTAGTVFVKSMKAIYGYIGIVMVYSSLWFFIGLLPFLLATTLGKTLSGPVLFGLVLANFFTIGPAAAAVYANTARIIAGGEVTARDFFHEFRRLYGKSLLLSLVNVFVLGILVADLFFAIRNPNRWIQLLSGLWVYFLIFWVLMMNWMLPLLVHQRTGPITVIKRAALLTVDNLAVTMFISLLVIILTGLSVVLAAPIMIFFMGSISFVHNYAFSETMKKYEEPSAEQGED